MLKSLPVPPRRRYHLIPDSRASQNSLPDAQTSASLLHFQYRLLNASSSPLTGPLPSAESTPDRLNGNLQRSMSDSSLNLVLNGVFPHSAQQSRLQLCAMSSDRTNRLPFSSHNKRLAAPTLPQLAMSSYRLRSVPRLLTKASACTQDFVGGNSAKSAVDRWDFGLDSLVNEATREKEVLLDEE
uniref:Uncharacterized protein n=1 Tax=Plectus sambesii TaxID=2011161 RepID=A0A914VMS6_9BILA